MMKEDPREGCELCKMAYGMEKPKLEDLCSSENCTALIAADKKKPDYIIIFPTKIHEMNVELVKKRKELYAEIETLIRRAKWTLKKKYGAKRFRVAWCNGGILLRLAQDKKHPLNSVKAHAHCKMEVFYK